MPYIYSTLAADNAYTAYVKGGGDLPSVERSVLIKGGTGVAGAWNRLETPQGVVTEVTDEELAFLQQQVVFNRHVENGFLHVDDKLYQPEKVAADQNRNDPGAPLTESDFADPVNGKVTGAPTVKGGKK